MIAFNLKRFCGVVVLSAGMASGAVIPVPGGEFAVKEAKHGAEAVPPKWKMSAGSKGDSALWVAGEEHAFLLKKGVTLETELTVAPLSEKEGGVKGDWRGIAHVDFWGMDEAGDATLSLQVVKDGAVVAGKNVRVRKDVVAKQGDLTAPLQRHWVLLDEEKMKSLLGQKITLRVSCAGPQGVVVSGVGMCRVYTKPTKKLMGKANGHLGPDLLGAGSLGFDALTVHKQRALQVLGVREGGPAATAGLEVGDVILEVNRKPLPENNIGPGWEWFEHSHEAILGRAVEQARGRKGIVSLSIVRGGEMKRLDLKLAKPMEFTTVNPAGDKVAAAMHQDMLDFLVRTQREDGSWSRDPIRTTFSALALLATRDATHGEPGEEGGELFAEPLSGGGELRESGFLARSVCGDALQRILPGDGG